MGVLVGREAPDFTAPAVLGDGTIVTDFNLTKNIKGKHAVVFFYPLDFTFVCPSELIAFDHRLDEFKKRGVEVIGVSIDSHYTHNAWRNTPINEGGIGAVAYPLVADVKHEICQAYDVEHPAAGVAFRASFLIDPYDSKTRAGAGVAPAADSGLLARPSGQAERPPSRTISPPRAIGSSPLSGETRC